MATSDAALAARDAYSASSFSENDELGRLDLATRSRTSLFPWRGQFSPDLVQILLSEHDGRGPVLDPFMGSGTVLFEALRIGRSSAGTEINPGAFIFARLAEVAALELQQRKELLTHASGRLATGLMLLDAAPLDGRGFLATVGTVSQGVRHILEASFLLACRNKESATPDQVAAAYGVVSKGLMGLGEGGVTAVAKAEDARYLPFENETFEQVITSPPYINVFNYHQQFRSSVESLGYRPLKVATSEIGSNRKHRQNRLMTVVQYCLDMSMALDEMARVTRSGGELVLVIGRESRVRKIPFDNGVLLGSLLHARADLQLRRRSERKFTSRFGEVIVEDLLFVSRTNSAPQLGDLEFARSVGVLGLLHVMSDALPLDVRSDLENAIAVAPQIAVSPRVNPASAGLGLEGGADGVGGADALDLK